jgi:glycine hydroxymethyltransferase
MPDSALRAYLEKVGAAGADAGFLAYICALEHVARVSPLVARMVVQELADQRANLKLIASENYSSLAVQLAMGNLLTDKYAEGIPGRRYYAGCENVDAIENFACEQARKLFDAEHAYVQPHSGADANVVAFWAILSARVEAPALAVANVESALALTPERWAEIRHQLGNQRLLALDFASGGHLTHGYRNNVSARMFESHGYSVSRRDLRLDYDEIAERARAVKPLVLLAGYSAYPRLIDFARMRAIADEVGAVLMVDMAHFAGLVAGRALTGVHDPVPYADVVTTTTHKTLRGPRGGMVLCKKPFAEYVDRGCPMVQGGPLPHVLAAKGLCFTEALRPEFRQYVRRIIENAQALAAGLVEERLSVLTGGTDNHQVIVDVANTGLTGRQAEAVLRECRVTANRNAVPFDRNSPLITSGLRLGTPALTTLGMGPDDMREIASLIRFVLANTKPAVTAKGETSKIAHVIENRAKEQAAARVDGLLSRYPVYPELDLDLLREWFVSEQSSAGAKRRSAR